MFTRIDAINEMLDAIDEQPISSLNDLDTLEEVHKASRILDRTLLRVLAKGWSCNTSFNTTLKRQPDNHLVLPSNILRIDTTGPHKHLDVAVRSQEGSMQLFNRTDNTWTFNVDPVCDVIVAQEFDDLPIEMRFYVAARAAREFQQHELGNDQVTRAVQRKEAETYAAFMDAEAEQDDANILRDSAHCRYVSGRNHHLSGR